MTKPSLSSIYRQATAARDSAIDADDVARLAGGERLGHRHDAAVEALAGSAPALAAFRAVRDVHAQAQALGGSAQVVVALPQRHAARPSLAMAAGVMGMAVLAGLLWRAGPETGTTPEHLMAGTGDDRIFGVSYETDTAVAMQAPSTGADPIFIDEFGG